MAISKHNPSDFFATKNPEQGIGFPNYFICRSCESAVSFPQHSLADGASNRYLNKPRKSKLKPEIAPQFEETIAEFLSTDLSRFVLDFHCPKCQQPYVIGFEWSEFHMADPRYFPLQVWDFSKIKGV